MAIILAENSIQLVPDGTIFFHIALIIFMVYVLNKTLFRPINLILDERERRTKGGTGSAQNILKQVKENIERYENSLRQARTESYKLLERAHAEALGKRQDRLDILRGELNAVLMKQKAALKEQSEAAQTSLRADAQQIASEITRQILHRGQNLGSSPAARP